MTSVTTTQTQCKTQPFGRWRTPARKASRKPRGAEDRGKKNKKMMMKSEDEDEDEDDDDDDDDDVCM